MREKAIRKHLNQNWLIDTPNIINKLKSELTFKVTSSTSNNKRNIIRFSFSMLSLLLGVFIITISLNFLPNLLNEKSVPSPNDGFLSEQPNDSFPFLSIENIIEITQNDIPLNDEKKALFIENFNGLSSYSYYDSSIDKTVIPGLDFEIELNEIIVETNKSKKIKVFLSKDGLIIIQDNDKSYYYHDNELFKDFLP